MLYYEIGSAILLYLIIPSLPSILIDKLKPFYLLSYNKWYLSELSYFFLVKPLKFIFNILVLLFSISISQVNFVNKKNSIIIKLSNFFLIRSAA
jgi:hypothetical protein